jgi:hypothetical protein
MSSQETILNTGKQAIFNTETEKIFLWDNRYTPYPYNNSAYEDVTLEAGTVMGVVTVTGWVKPLASGASDGSQIPVGILAESCTVEGGALVNLSICVAGDVNANALVFDGADNLDTTISSRRLRDRIGSDTVGIKLVNSTEMTGYDNA